MKGREDRLTGLLLAGRVPTICLEADGTSDPPCGVEKGNSGGEGLQPVSCASVGGVAGLMEGFMSSCQMMEEDRMERMKGDRKNGGWRRWCQRRDMDCLEDMLLLEMMPPPPLPKPPP